MTSAGAAAACDPISWLRLERYHLGELPRAEHDAIAVTWPPATAAAPAWIRSAAWRRPTFPRCRPAWRQPPRTPPRRRRLPRRGGAGALGARRAIGAGACWAWARPAPRPCWCWSSPHRMTRPRRTVRSSAPRAARSASSWCARARRLGCLGRGGVLRPGPVQGPPSAVPRRCAHADIAVVQADGTVFSRRTGRHLLRQPDGAPRAFRIPARPRRRVPVGRPSRPPARTARPAAASTWIPPASKDSIASRRIGPGRCRETAVGSDPFGYRFLFDVAGSYLTARLAPDRPMRHALALGAIGLVLSIAGAVALWSVGPAWYPLGLAASALPCAWLGARLRGPR